MVSGHQRQTGAALALAILLCWTATAGLLRHARGYLHPRAETDLMVYLLGADLVRSGQSATLYDQAANGTDPQLRDADEGTAILHAARARGLPSTRMYVYPPLLADALVPLSLLPLWTALTVGRALLCAAILGAVVCLARLASPPLHRPSSLALVLFAVLGFSPLWQAMRYGQVTPILFVIWAATLLLFRRGALRASAAVLALGVLLKLTPVLLVLPMLLWQEWRWLRWFLASTLAGTLFIALVNGPAVLATYVLHVVPAMSAGVIDHQNQTLVCAVQLLWTHGKEAPAVAPPAAHTVSLLLTLLLVGWAATMTWRSAPHTDRLGRTEILSAWILLALEISPVTWIDALLIATVPLLLLWSRALREGWSAGAAALLAAATAGIGTGVGTQLVPGLSRWLPAYFAPLLSSLVLTVWILRLTAAQRATPAPSQIAARRARPAAMRHSAPSGSPHPS